MRREHPSVARAQTDVVAAKLALDLLTPLFQCVGAESWKALEKWLNDEIRGHMEMLARPNTTDDESKFLRGQIAAYRWIYGLGERVPAEIKAMTDKIGALQPSLQRLYSRRGVGAEAPQTPQGTTP